LINLIEPIIVYKFPRKTRDEVQTMLGIVKEDLRQTQFYQDVYQEGKLETVPLLLQLGLTLEQMADRLQLPLADVIHAAGS
jgi:predicted transposase YdaD